MLFHLEPRRVQLRECNRKKAWICGWLAYACGVNAELVGLECTYLESAKSEPWGEKHGFVGGWVA